jgi:hypothetical protein
MGPHTALVALHRPKHAARINEPWEFNRYIVAECVQTIGQTQSVLVVKSFVFKEFKMVFNVHSYHWRG